MRMYRESRMYNVHRSSREIGMHEGWGGTGRETHMDVFIYDVDSLNNIEYIYI